MSRDWRPVELYLADKGMEERGISLRDVPIAFHAYDSNGGADIPLTNEQSKKYYPELAFLFDRFDTLYEAYTDNKNVTALFDSLEKALRDIEERFDKAALDKDKKALKEFEIDRKFYSLSVTVFNEQKLSEVVEEWFFGRLDRNFYYSDENNDMFKLYIKNKIKIIE
jgi:hypothetical protein